VVAVSAVAFAETAETATAASPMPGDLVGMVGGIASTVFGGLVALVLLFLVWRNVGALRRRADDMQLAAITNPQRGLIGAHGSSGSGSTLASIADLDETPQARVQERLRMVATEKPDAIVGLMNGWLREEGRR